MTDRTLPCPNVYCEDGRVLLDDTRRSDWEPREVEATCETCDGAGRVDRWTCSHGCDRDFSCSVEMPAQSVDGSDGLRHYCRDCVLGEREEAVAVARAASMRTGIDLVTAALFGQRAR